MLNSEDVGVRSEEVIPLQQPFFGNIAKPALNRIGSRDWSRIGIQKSLPNMRKIAHLPLTLSHEIHFNIMIIPFIIAVHSYLILL